MVPTEQRNCCDKGNVSRYVVIPRLLISGLHLMFPFPECLLGPASHGKTSSILKPSETFQMSQVVWFNGGSVMVLFCAEIQ